MDEQNHRLKGIFFCVDEDGDASDKKIVDLMLENDKTITDQLVKNGIIRRLLVCDKEPDD